MTVTEFLLFVGALFVMVLFLTQVFAGSKGLRALVQWIAIVGSIVSAVWGTALFLYAVGVIP